MRLAPFIRANAKQIITEWEKFAATLVPAAEDMTPLALRNHIAEMLAFLAADIETPQSESEQVKKSHGGKPKAIKHSAAEIHAAVRLAGGFNLDQMVSEFRALRASVVKLWIKQLVDANPDDIADLTRFHENIDQQLTESVNHYSKNIAASKDLFLGILGTDLRDPLITIMAAAGLTLRMAHLHERQEMLVSEILENASRASETVTHLFDLARARFGSGLPIIPQPMDMGFVSRTVVDEFRAMHPSRDFKIEISGELEGHWDKARVGQVLANLLGNAVRYSFTDSSIGVKVEGHPDEVILSVHNEGVPIPSDAIPKIFHSLNRAQTQDGEPHPEAVNLGLGLYITEEVVTAHGGTIAVVSSEKKGTTLTLRFPRSTTQSSAYPGPHQ
jgi:signal transduction histidine kinase